MSSRGAAFLGAVVVGVLAIASGCGRSVPSHDGVTGGAGVAWGTDLDAALARAGAEDKLVMVDFFADWCGWCKRLDETTYADPEVQDALRSVVPVKLDGERGGRQAAGRFRVSGYPTIVFLDASGREVGRIPGYLPPRPFLEELRDIVARG